MSTRGGGAHGSITRFASSPGTPDAVHVGQDGRRHLHVDDAREVIDMDACVAGKGFSQGCNASSGLQSFFGQPVLVDPGGNESRAPWVPRRHVHELTPQVCTAGGGEAHGKYAQKWAPATLAPEAVCSNPPPHGSRPIQPYGGQISPGRHSYREMWGQKVECQAIQQAACLADLGRPGRWPP